MPVTAGAGVFEWNQGGYEIEETTGLTRNISGAYQGPGASTGLTYGPLARVKLDTGFVLAEVWKWHGAVASRVGGDAGKEGSKVSVTVGAAPVTIMSVAVTVGYNVTDGGATYGVSTSLKGLFERLLRR